MPKKRANGEGNIRKRKDGRWEGRYTAGYDSKTGKRIIKNVLGKTQAEVKEKLAQAQQESAGLISSTMGISEPREECFQCFYTAAFARLVSLEEVESLVIEGEKIPLPKGN